ncbi:MAG: hypothetical protein V4721_16540 [Bacteroidota bacterium]
MANKKVKPESAAVKAFKEKWGNATKLWPSEEKKALAEAEERNKYVPKEKTKSGKKRKSGKGKSKRRKK